MGRAMKDSGVEWIGEIPEEWNVVPMKSIIISNDGGIWGDDPVGDETDKVVIRSTEQSVDGKWQITAPAMRNLSGLRFSRYRILPDDLLMTKSSGSDLHIGKTTLADQYFAENECYYSNFIQRVRVNQFAKFYWYILNSTIARDQFVYLQNTTSGLGNINAEDIEKIYVPLPVTDEQYRISHFLDEQRAKICSTIERIRASIEEYKHLKQAVITQAVTKGVRGDRPMKDSGIDWIGEIPVEWDVYRVANLYDERNEPGCDERPVLMVSIHSGVSDDEVKDEDRTRKAMQSEDKSKYKRVYPGDLVYNMMRAWQGAFGAVRVDGLVSPAYVVAKPKKETDTRYIEALFRIPSAIEEMRRYSYGIADFRMRLYWQYFKNIRFCLPTLEEQKEIADYLDAKCAEIDALIAQKEQLLTELENYKKSLIYEYVTGKKEVPSEY